MVVSNKTFNEWINVYKELYCGVKKDDEFSIVMMKVYTIYHTVGFWFWKRRYPVRNFIDSEKALKDVKYRQEHWPEDTWTLEVTNVTI